MATSGYRGIPAARYLSTSLKFNSHIMMKTKCKFAMSVAAFGFFAGAVGAAAEDTSSYSVPKGHPPISQTPAGVCPVPGVKVDAAPIRWTSPAGWNQLPATAIRIGNFLVAGPDGKKAEVAITSFPGTVGTELDNVNRWRGEIGLEPVEQGGISSQSVTVDSLPGKLYDFAGASANTMVVSLPREGRTWFFKLRGDKDVVNGAKARFLDFLKSVRFL